MLPAEDYPRPSAPRGLFLPPPPGAAAVRGGAAPSAAARDQHRGTGPDGVQPGLDRALARVFFFFWEDWGWYKLDALFSICTEKHC